MDAVKIKTSSLLIADGNKERHAELAQHLKSIYDIRLVSSIADVLQGSDLPDLIVCGQNLSDGSCIELCRKVRQHSETFTLPIIILAGQPSEELLAEAFAAGASDILLDTIKVFELQIRLAACLKQRQNMITQETLIRSLRQRAEKDPLTGFYNRQTFSEYAMREIARSRRQAMPIVLLMIDADGYKKINDSYGHLVGDEVLIELANLLYANVRRYDVFARFGGDEFICLLSGVGLDGGIKIANKLRQIVETHNFCFKQLSFNLTLSIGVAACQDWPCDSASDIEILRRMTSFADQYLYQAKSNGRNCVTGSVWQWPIASSVTC